MDMADPPSGTCTGERRVQWRCPCRCFDPERASRCAFHTSKPGRAQVGALTHFSGNYGPAPPSEGFEAE